MPERCWQNCYPTFCVHAIDNNLLMASSCCYLWRSVAETHQDKPISTVGNWQSCVSWDVVEGLLIHADWFLWYGLPPFGYNWRMCDEISMSFWYAIASFWLLVCVYSSKSFGLTTSLDSYFTVYWLPLSVSVGWISTLTWRLFLRFSKTPSDLTGAWCIETDLTAATTRVGSQDVKLLPKKRRARERRVPSTPFGRVIGYVPSVFSFPDNFDELPGFGK